MQFLSDKTVAERYDTSRATIWRWAREGKIPKPVRLSAGSTRWNLDELLQFEKKQEAL